MRKYLGIELGAAWFWSPDGAMDRFRSGFSEAGPSMSLTGEKQTAGQPLTVGWGEGHPIREPPTPVGFSQGNSGGYLGPFPTAAVMVLPVSAFSSSFPGPAVNEVIR